MAHEQFIQSVLVAGTALRPSIWENLDVARDYLAKTGHDVSAYDQIRRIPAITLVTPLAAEAHVQIADDISRYTSRYGVRFSSDVSARVNVVGAEAAEDAIEALKAAAPEIEFPKPKWEPIPNLRNGQKYIWGTLAIAFLLSVSWVIYESIQLWRL